MSRTFGDPIFGGAQLAKCLKGGMDDDGMSVDRRVGVEFHQVRLQHDLLAADVEFVRGHHPVNGVVDIHRVGRARAIRTLETGASGIDAARPAAVVPGQGDTRRRSDSGQDFPPRNLITLIQGGLPGWDNLGSRRPVQRIRVCRHQLSTQTGDYARRDASAVSASSSMVRGVG